MSNNMLSFNSFLIYLITPEMQGMVNLKRIACFAETVVHKGKKKKNEIPLFLSRHVQCAECLKLVIEPRIVSNNFVAPAEMQNSLNLSGSYTVSCLFITLSL